MRKRWISITLCAAMIAGSLASCGLKSPDTAATTTPATIEASATEAAGAEGNAVEEARTEAAADINDIPEVTLVMAEINSLGTIVGRTDSKFRETVEEMPGGKVKIDLQASDVLGSENDVPDTMLDGGGIIDISRISAFALTSYDAEKSVFPPIPYTFANHDHFWKFVDSDLAPELLIEPHDNGLGVRGLYYDEEGFRHFFTVREVKGSDDLKGMELRISNDPIVDGTVEGLGASPTVVSFNELHSALQTGVVDNVEQSIANYSPNAFQEVAPNLILGSHTPGMIQIIITDEAWDELTEEQRNILMETGKAASQFNRTISEEAENKVLEGLKADGINVVEAPNIKPWQDVCKDVIESSTEGQTGLYQQILDMNKQ